MKLAREMREGLEGVTAGEWCEGDRWIFVESRSGIASHAPENILSDKTPEAQQNVRHIVNCQPDNIRLLLDALEAQAARIEELERALKPFALEAEQWTGFEDDEPLVEGWKGGPSTQLYVRDLRFAHSTLEGK